ncbi:Phosphoribosyl 1,2-cyclic phosphodiesterase [Halanaerobium congolense]|uniref:Phosphoribosyl 1,2-cyclic phosphodiesterase n=1 Tax=Halanaerobium congolense TaxID=54121 RepID=A0A1G8PWQ2_9FIRM|nr:MBL fold metallo-hydrolase [Halanaerobium congolense]SDI96696.1 Phosphoribosyl 1,2-cyclic phosphodiesterase [Halanaerobium congolense]SES91390.1 Phosphoribosyl 1,2-cyclic phosphodiesterase [Halanaerobium congolense]
MLEIKALASGSSGNCYRVNDGKTSLLIEAGISIQKIKESLDFTLTDIVGCLISHEHGDHSKSISDVIAAGVDCYLSPGTIDVLDSIDSNHHRIHAISAKKPLQVGSWVVKPFEVQHDANDPIGFILWSRNTGDKLIYITDSFYSKYTFNKPDYIMVECNYSEEILKKNVEAGKVHPVLEKRLKRSHFSLENVKDFLNSNDLRNTKEIWLLHLSDTNSDEKLFKKEVQELTGKLVFIA